MLIYIPSPVNASLFDSYCNQNSIPFTKQTVERLGTFVGSAMSNLSYVTVLAIDFAALEDSDDEIMAALKAFRSMYDKGRIVVVALGQAAGSPLLGRIYKQGIYNIITNGTSEEIARCLSADGMKPSDTVRFRVDEPEPPMVEKQNPVKAKPLPFWKRSKETLDVPPPMEQSYSPPPIAQEHVILQPQYRKPKLSITVGLCGVQRRIGTTQQALLICEYLNNCGFKAAFLETNAHNAIKTIAKYYSINKNKALNQIQYAGIDMFSDYNLPQ